LIYCLLLILIYYLNIGVYIDPRRNTCARRRELMVARGDVDAWRSSGRYRRPRCGSPFPCEFQFALVSPQQRKRLAVWWVRRRKLAEAVEGAELPGERWRLPEWLRIPSGVKVIPCAPWNKRRLTSQKQP